MKNLDPALEMKIQDIKDLIYRCLIQPQPVLDPKPYSTDTM
jgi:hypothetical protein